MSELFLAFLAQHDDAGWLRAECGVSQDAEPHVIRLARMTQADGPVSIVIPGTACSVASSRA